MILLLGGTADTDHFIAGLHSAGYAVCLSQATDTELALVNIPEKMVRGKLGAGTLAQLLTENNMTAIVDITHPYAVEIKKMAREVAQNLHMPYFRYVRAASTANNTGFFTAKNHLEAANISCKPGTTVLVTVGSKNIVVYADTARRCSCRVIARVLDVPQSVDACITAGIPVTDIIAARGPFSVEENRKHIRLYNAQVLVTKDSGAPGGVDEKVEAAKMEGCQVVMVERPQVDDLVPFTSMDDLLAGVTCFRAKKDAYPPQKKTYPIGD